MVEYLKPDFPQDAFEGTADYYSRYRIPYPQTLIDDLINRVKPPQQSLLLDLAAGPGRIALALAPYFSKVQANDLDSEMVSVGKIQAKERKVSNIEWFIGRAEELKIESNSVNLITISEAFHRLDQSLILDLAHNWLKPGGHLAIIGMYMYGIWDWNEAWQSAISKIIDKWTPGPSVSNKPVQQDYELILKDKKFILPSTHSFEFRHSWTVDSILGYIYSTSRCSKKVLGSNAVEFESELKAELLKISPKGEFSENIKCGYTAGKKQYY